MFSSRTGWQRTPNHLTMLLEERRSLGLPVLDLTTANPTTCGIGADDRILQALVDTRSLVYDPEPFGLVTARNAIADYYFNRHNFSVDPSRIVLTASTSEAYGMLFMLLCDAGDSVLVPAPSYPLFEYLGHLPLQRVLDL